MDLRLNNAIPALAPARYGVGVSGGADSVALLHLLHHQRGDLYLHVIHLDHQTRGRDSADDAEFVRQLAIKWNLPQTIARRDEIEPGLSSRPNNRSALYRAVRHALYRRVAHEDGLAAVLLAHHADDQAETILQHLLRGTGPTGMPRESRIGDLLILRPLLEVPGQALREYLRSVDQVWREDASNLSALYSRNRLRRVLEAHPQLTPALLDLERSFADVRQWAESSAPDLPDEVPVALLRDLPKILAVESARRWLLARGAPAADLTSSAVERLLTMATDAASVPRQHFPGGLLIRRRQGRIFADRPAAH